jgi:hypothetical protein
VTFESDFLTKQEESDWSALQRFKAHGAARVHFTFKCLDENAANDLRARLGGISSDDPSLQLVPEQPAGPTIDHESIRELSELLAKVTGIPSRPDATIRILDSAPGWKVSMRTMAIENREQLAQVYRNVRTLLEDPRWEWEGGGVGP